MLNFYTKIISYSHNLLHRISSVNYWRPNLFALRKKIQFSYREYRVLPLQNILECNVRKYFLLL